MWRNIIASVIVVTAIAAAWYAFAPVETGRDVIHVIVARQDLPQGTALAEDMLETRTLPRAYAQQGAIEVRMMTDIKLPVGLTTAVRINKGDQVTENCLVNAGAKPAPKAADGKTLSRDHYQEGLKYFQNSNYQAAVSEWQQAVKLDPANKEAAAGLERVRQITAK